MMSITILTSNKANVMGEWATFLHQVQTHLTALEEAGCDIPLFRGHSDSEWKLLCGLGRRNESEFKKKNLEPILYHDFTSLAGPLLSRYDSPWDILFAMQHHGLPTRLLDWSSTFSVALYFALKPYIFDTNFRAAQFARKRAPCVWILDPFELNFSVTGTASILSPNLDFKSTYAEYFILDTAESLESEVLAISPTRTDRRLAVQQGFFTLHSALFAPLEVRQGSFLKKFVLPPTALDDALGFISLAGMNEYVLFPDLDGLARFLLERHVG
jgi:hypothetical protein